MKRVLSEIDEQDYLRWLVTRGWEQKLSPLFDRSEKEGNGRSIESPVRRRLFEDGISTLPPRADEEEYASRIQFELDLIFRKKFTRYFLMVADVYRFVHEQDIPRGDGRGSVVASLVAYLLDLTRVDPIAYNLLFFRFLSEDRNDFPDIDMDFADDRREEVVQYARDRYGEENVARIMTYIRMRGKAALQHSARVHGQSITEASRLAQGLVSHGKGSDRAFRTIEDSLSLPGFQEYAQKHPQVILPARELEGTIMATGLHAAGVVISDRPIHTFAPVIQMDGHAVLAVDMTEAEGFGLLKADFLGLRTLRQMKATMQLIARRHDPESCECSGCREQLRLEMTESLRQGVYNAWSARIPLEDPQVLQMLGNGYCFGIFQLETLSFIRMLKRLRPTRFNDVVDANALNRPGPMRSGSVDHYLDRKSLLKEIPEVHPLYDRLTRHRRGELIYQEDLMLAMRIIGGFDWPTTNKVRSLIAKSQGGETIAPYWTPFWEGAQKVSVPEGIARSIFQTLVNSGNYLFNECLTGDTVVKRPGSAKNKGGDITIADLYEAQRSDTPWGKKIRWGRLNLYQRDADGRLRPRRMKKIYDKGVAPVFCVATLSGNSIKATANHRLLTDRGYLRVDEMEIGDSLCVMISEEPIKKGCQTERARGKNYEGRGVPGGPQNPAWIDGRTTALEVAKDTVRYRANGRCEFCGKPEEGRFEVAHLLPLEAFNEDYLRYHSAFNLKWLCNPCHKKLDYKKGDRKKVHSKGKATGYDEIVSIMNVGEERVYDIEMATEEHNFLANGIVSHNSHSAGYSATSVRQSWIKYYYPAEFLCACLNSTTRRDKLSGYLRESRRLGCPVKYPCVNRSGSTFEIQGEGRRRHIRAGFQVIRGVQKAGLVLEQLSREKGPFKSFDHFVKICRGRVIHKGVIATLLASGAMDAIVKNPRAVYENLDLVLSDKKGDREAIDQLWNTYAELPAWSAGERTILQAQHLMAPPEGNLVDCYPQILARLDSVHTIYTPTQIIDQKGEIETAIMIGVVTLFQKAVREGQYYEDEEEEGEEEQENRLLGWARMMLEDLATGLSATVDPDTFERLREVLERSEGHVGLFKIHRKGNSELLNVIDVTLLSDLSVKLEKEAALTAFEAYLIQDPMARYGSLREKNRILHLSEVREQLPGASRYQSFRVWGYVTARRMMKTKKGESFAILTLEEEGTHLEVIVWPDAWARYGKGILSESFLAFEGTVVPPNDYSPHYKIGVGADGRAKSVSQLQEDTVARESKKDLALTGNYRRKA